MITIFEDSTALNFEPISLTRPVFDIRYGSLTLYERLKELCNNKITAFYVRDSLKEFVQRKHLNSLLSYEETSNQVWLNGRVIWTKDLIDRITSSKKSVFVTEDNLVALNLPNDNSVIVNLIKDFSRESIPEGIVVHELKAEKINYLWDILSNIKNIVIGEQKGSNSSFKKYKNIVIDESEGPVIIQDNVVIEPFTYLKGPLIIDVGSKILSHSRIQNSIIGPGCKIGGEVSGTIFQGWSNKGHYGFLGDSFVGEWVNFGAGATNSNLKNNYKSVLVNVNNNIIDTNSLFIGLFIGDHSKISIGSQINTGTNIGVGCSILAQTFPDTHIPSFSFYNNGNIKKINFGKFIDTTKIVKDRRNQFLDEKEIKLLKKIHKSSLIS